MILEKPEVFRQGSKYGVRIESQSSVSAYIKTDISTEVSPLVGTESQSAELADSLTRQFEEGGSDIWETNLFGKSLRDMVTEQMEAKVNDVPDSLRVKVKDHCRR